ncbi:programmed cell death 1 ligand 1-like [Mobula birostris]|uniref:programmed cell death 1 ligand 1-like n=1 Tax=Mobula birostris TaxID=1983395 RepID=UPI003B281ACE
MDMLHHSRDMHREIAEMTNRNKKQSWTGIIQDKDGNILFENDKVESRWMEYIRDLYYYGQVSEKNTEGPEILVPEVRASIGKLKTGKVCGVDGITAEMLKCLGNSEVEEIMKLCKTIYSTGKWPTDFVVSEFVMIPKKSKSMKWSDLRTPGLLHCSLLVQQLTDTREDGSFGKMKIISLLFILGAHIPSNAALFMVTAPRLFYTASYGNNITMECIFPVESNFQVNMLRVYWYHILENGTSQLVYKVLNGKAVLEDQSVEYRERVALLLDELHNGRAVLEINQVRVSDAGTYRCVISLNGVDYKESALRVTASYKDIETLNTKGKMETEFVCQSSGYPLAEVMWYNANGADLNKTANTTHFTGTNGLYNIRSVLRIRAETNETYVCMFWIKDLNMSTSAVLQIKEIKSFDDLPEKTITLIRRSYLIATIIIPLSVLLGVIIILIKLRRHWQVKRKIAEARSLI